MDDASEITLRLATAVDTERITELLDVSRRDRPLSERQTSVKLPVDQSGPLFVYLAENRGSDPVGLAALQRNHSIVSGDNFLLLTDIFVREDFRRHGVATLLMNEAISLGRFLGCQALRLLVSDANQPALATFSRAGLTQETEERLLHVRL